jgi:hypothetical protein
MSHCRLKTTYNEMGAYGSVDKKTLYAHHNNSCDIVSFYDENGNFLFCVEDTMDNNLFDAIKRLFYAWEDARANKLMEGVEHMEPEEFNKIGH